MANAKKEDKKPVYKKWWFWVIIVVVVIGIGGATSNSNKSSDPNNSSDTSSTNTNDSKPISSTNNTLALGETFEFDNLDITLGQDYSFTTLDNQFSDKNGATIIKLPITVVNKKDETHSLNMFYIHSFGTQGTELDSVSAYFTEDCVEFAGDLRPGASYTKYLYLVYDGDGTYAVEFSQIYGGKTTVEFNITK